MKWIFNSSVLRQLIYKSFLPRLYIWHFSFTVIILRDYSHERCNCNFHYYFQSCLRLLHVTDVEHDAPERRQPDVQTWKRQDDGRNHNRVWEWRSLWPSGREPRTWSSNRVGMPMEWQQLVYQWKPITFFFRHLQCGNNVIHEPDSSFVNGLYVIHRLELWSYLLYPR